MSYTKGSVPASPGGLPAFLKKELERIQRAFSGISSAWADITGIPGNVTALGGLTGAADEVPYFTGVSAMALASLTPYARTILACANAGAARTALGLGGLAVLNVVTEATISLSNVTTDDVSTARHGFAPKAPNDATKYLDGTGNYSVPTVALPTFPLGIPDGLLFRYNSTLSQTDLSTLQYANKIYDISGNGHDSFSNTTNPPKWVEGGFLGKFNCLFFDFFMKLMINGMPSIASPFAGTVVFVGKSFQSNGNSHIYNWAGNPIGFGATTPLDVMYNGTLPAVHAYSAASKNNLSDGSQGHFCVGIHAYNGAASVQRLNGLEETKSPGTTASGSTNFFTIGSDSSTGVGGATGQTCRMILAEICTFNTALNATNRAALDTYYKAFYGLTY